MILIEENFENVKVLNESVEGNKMFLRGVFAEANVKNRNGRIYRLDEMTKEVDRINEGIRRGEYVLGELDHPSVLEVKLDNVSHKIVELAMVGNQVIGKAEIIDKHPKGAILRSLIEAGIKIGVSTRGAGQLNESTGEVRNFKLVTVDAVATPSCRSAYPETIMEGLALGMDYTELKELGYGDVKENATEQEYIRKEMLKLIESLK